MDVLGNLKIGIPMIDVTYILLKNGINIVDKFQI
jgi:hypothetical protein